jgi:NAD-dependent dihydropyrimidine dehydrogenase PreA subunit
VPIAAVWLERGAITIGSNQECPPRSYPPRERHRSMSIITIGIDPHKASHTAVAVDEFDFVVDEICIRSCPTQAILLREWADGLRDDRV